MNRCFKIRIQNKKHIFESQRINFESTIQTNQEILQEGILHTIYGNHCFIFKYRNTYFTSKKIDMNNYMIHFPLGIPIIKNSLAAILCLDSKYENKITFDIHMEMCTMKDLVQNHDFVHVLTNDGNYLKINL